MGPMPDRCRYRGGLLSVRPSPGPGPGRPSPVQEDEAVLPTLTLLTLSTLGFGEPADSTVSPPEVGASVSDFSLKDTHRRPRRLSGFKDRKATVVAFIDSDCPVVNLYIPTLIALHKEYSPKGVQLLAINSSRQDSFVSASAHAQERGIPFPVLKDFDQS